jgi:hypothetical protein
VSGASERSHRLYSWWLAVATPAVRLWFELRRGVGWRGVGWQRAGLRRRIMVVLSVLGAMSFGAGVTVAATGTGQPAPLALGTASLQATANRAQAAAWIAGQLSPNVTVACDPQMCAQVRSSGLPAARLTIVPPGASPALGSGVVVATPVIRDQFGVRLAAVDAPLVIASFGSGAERVDIRAVAPDGAAALRSQLAAARTRDISAGKQLLDNKDIQAAPAARALLLAGQVDPRLLVTLSALASQMPLKLVAFDDPSPGASPAVPLRGAEIGAASPAGLSAMLAFLRAQQAPYLPAVAAITRSASGPSLVTVRFDAQGLQNAGGL